MMEMHGKEQQVIPYLRLVDRKIALVELDLQFIHSPVVDHLPFHLVLETLNM
jgi:hypothetical protein